MRYNARSRNIFFTIPIVRTRKDNMCTMSLDQYYFWLKQHTSHNDSIELVADNAAVHLARPTGGTSGGQYSDDIQDIPPLRRYTKVKQRKKKKENLDLPLANTLSTALQSSNQVFGQLAQLDLKTDTAVASESNDNSFARRSNSFDWIDITATNIQNGTKMPRRISCTGITKKSHPVTPRIDFAPRLPSRQETVDARGPRMPRRSSDLV